MNEYRNLFKPLRVKNMTIKNRIIMLPVATNCASRSGDVTDSQMKFYELRAKGGTGLIIVECASVYSPQGTLRANQLRIDHDSYVSKLFKLCETIHKYDTKVALTLNHAGAAAPIDLTNIQPVSSSDLRVNQHGDVPRPLKKKEIEKIARKFGEAARRAVMAGFDAVELECGHGFLINQFLSPLFNDRTDEFGGNPENRARFAKMVLQEVRNAVGPMYPIIVRISADELTEGGNTLEDTLEQLQYYIEEADLIDVSAGSSVALQYVSDVDYLKDGWRSYMAKEIRDRYNKPVITSGNVRDPQVTEKILADGYADAVGMGRGLIADPDWVTKIQLNKEDEIRKCISCNIGCVVHRNFDDQPIRCTINPAIPGGDEYKERKVKEPCNVVVVGAGVAGLEAACTAAEVGCSVVLIEKEKELGGIAKRISAMSNKKRMSEFPEYMIRRAMKLKNLFICKGMEADAEFIKGFKPDIIVNATGSNPKLPNGIPGLNEIMSKPIEERYVFDIFDLVDTIPGYPKNMSGYKIVVIGGGNVGLDVVEFFTERGADISICEKQTHFGIDLDPATRAAAYELMDEYGVHQYVAADLIKVEENAFTIRKDYKDIRLEFDYGYLCLGMQETSPHLDELYDAFGYQTEIVNIGDSARTRRMIDGVREGRNILNVLERRGFLSTLTK
ncbi:MAG: NAD(P)/FAD-dependent oxidoreductase [Lachnospiraceae bacterium]|nr:NAD(P)/FAD-dependent oxidoreductase [Lachnospiraceae bacterium]